MFLGSGSLGPGISEPQVQGNSAPELPQSRLAPPASAVSQTQISRMQGFSQAHSCQRASPREKQPSFSFVYSDPPDQLRRLGIEMVNSKQVVDLKTQVWRTPEPILKVGKAWLSIWSSAIGGVSQIPKIPGLAGTFPGFGDHCFPLFPFPLPVTL